MKRLRLSGVLVWPWSVRQFAEYLVGRYADGRLAVVLEPVHGLLSWHVSVSTVEPKLLGRAAQIIVEAGLLINVLAPADACLSVLAPLAKAVPLASLLSRVGLPYPRRSDGRFDPWN